MCAQCACECAVHPFSLLTFSSFGASGFLRSRTLPLPLSERKTPSKRSEKRPGLAVLVGVDFLCWSGRRGPAEFFGEVLLQQSARLWRDNVLKVKLFSIASCRLRLASRHRSSS